MERKFSLLLLAAVGVAGPAGMARAANLLLDPDFETPVGTNNVDVQVAAVAPAGQTSTLPWYDLINYTVAGKTGDTAFISSDIPAFSASPASDRINAGALLAGKTGANGGNAAHGGDQFAYAFTVGQPAGTQGGVGQLVTGINAGDTYVGSAYFFDKSNGAAPDGDRFQSGGSNDTVQIVFQDSAGNAIGAPVVSTAVAFGSPENTWIQLTTLPAIAPVGATQALFELVLTRGATGGVMFADDASLQDLSAVPEPATAALALLVFVPSLVRRRRAR